MKVLKILLPLILAVTLVAGVGLTGVAAEEPEDTQNGVQTVEPQPEDTPKFRGRKASGFQRGKPEFKVTSPEKRAPGFSGGKVVEIDEAQTYFVVQRGENEPVTVMVDNGTKYYIVRNPIKAVSQLKNQFGPKPRVKTDAATITSNGLSNKASFVRQRIAQFRQNQGAANDTNPAGPRKPKLFNAARLRNSNGPVQLVSTPEAAPEIIPVNDENEDADPAGWGQWQRLRQFAKKATFDDLAIGDRVLVRLVPSDEKPVARLVLIFKQSPYKRIGGTITDVSPDNQTITIAPTNDSEPVTLRYNENTIFNLKGTIAVEPGQLARATYHTEGMMAKAVTVRLPGSTDLSEPGNGETEGS